MNDHARTPERAPGGQEQDLPLFRWANGEPVKRSYVREILGLAAVRLGLPRSRVGVHSLRVGGATALWVGTQGSATLVRRLGRWASDAVHAYLWDLPVLTEHYRGHGQRRHGGPVGWRPQALG